MKYQIRLGLPEVKDYWESLEAKVRQGNQTRDEERLYRRWGKAMVLLANDPRHPGLNNHEIEVLSRRYGLRVWQSYLENKTAAAGRLYWIYGPGKGEITVIGLELHPEDKKSRGYEKVGLSATGEVEA